MVYMYIAESGMNRYTEMPVMWTLIIWIIYSYRPISQICISSTDYCWTALYWWKNVASTSIYNVYFISKVKNISDWYWFLNPLGVSVWNDQPTILQTAGIWWWFLYKKYSSMVIFTQRKICWLSINTQSKRDSTQYYAYNMDHCHISHER